MNYIAYRGVAAPIGPPTTGIEAVHQSIAQTKLCVKCGNQYPATLEYWHRAKRNNDGLCSWCKECMRSYCREWSRTHPEKHIASVRKWERNHPDKASALRRKWRLANREKLRTGERNWRHNNPEKARLSHQRRRALKRTLPSTLTSAEWEDILATYGYQCAYCDKTWLDCKLTQDHIVPISQGGGYTADNIVPACKSCNSRKNKRTPEQATMTLRIPESLG